MSNDPALKIKLNNNSLSWADMAELEEENPQSWGDLEKDMIDLEEDNMRQLDSLNKRFLTKPEVDNNEMLKLLGVPLDQSTFVRIFDECPNGLQLVHYISSTNDSVNHLRGVVVATHEKPQRVVCKSFPYTPEYTSKDFKMDDETIAKSKAIEGYEGTILRVFYYEDHWYISTHKKINGKSSRWSSPTFGELFNECLGLSRNEEPTFDTLNPNYCYVFLMSHPQNSLVCKNKNSILYHVITYDVQDNMNVVDHLLDHPSILYPKILNLKTSQEVSNHVNSMSWEDYSGVILFLPDGKMCKVVNFDYYTKRQIRGNEPNLRIRYFQLEKIKGMSSKSLVNILPEKKDFFQKIDKDYRQLVSYIYGCFEYRYINGNFLRLPREEYYLMQDINSYNPNIKGSFLNNDQKNIIKNQILKRLQMSSPRELNAMIKHMSET